MNYLTGNSDEYPNEGYNGLLKGEEIVESVLIEDIYDEILDGKRKKFPDGTWQDKTNAKRVVIHLIENRLSWSEDDVKYKFSGEFLIKNKLKGMLTRLFQGHAYDALNYAYPNKFKEWELKASQVGYWREELIDKALKWLFEERLKWSREEICNYFNTNTIANNSLLGLLNKRFNGNPFELLNYYQPDQFKPWELRKSNTIWNDELEKEATIWMFDNLKWSTEQIKDCATIQLFIDSGLATLVRNFDGNLYKILNNAYPNKFKEWELRRVSKGFYDYENNRKAAIKDFLVNQLKWPKESVRNNFSTSTLRENGFGFLVTKTTIKELMSVLQELYGDDMTLETMRQMRKTYNSVPKI